jgi:DNA-binding response OmpR family regulator
MGTVDTVHIKGVKLAILKLLIEAKGQIVSCDTLRRQIYGKRSDMDPAGYDREARLVRTQMWQLNRQLMGTGYRIVNRKGWGWFLTGGTDAKAST